MTEVLNLNAHGTIEQRVNALRHERGLWHQIAERWPASPDAELDVIASARSGDTYEALIEGPDCAAELDINGGMLYVRAFGVSEAAARRMLEEVRALVPRAQESDPDLVPVTFWSYSPRGPQSVRRMIDAPAFEEVEENYPATAGLPELLREWTPGAGGQLLLWHGDAGTGKTTALRALGRQWREWAELHYIVDPDRFFGDSASYMMSVMMGEGEDTPIEAGNGAKRKPAMWRVLVLEDCGEMLEADARQQVGQALSRLLNACDGLIGRGLRLLILVTTNEPLSKVHPAISRPGRCAARIEFGRFSADQAARWLGPRIPIGQGALTLADLYAIRAGHRTGNGARAIGFGSP